MIPDILKLRARLFAQRFWQPTSACMVCMPGGLANLLSGSHWALALQTGLATGLLALLLSFTPALALFRNRYGNALIVGCLTALADMVSHPGRSIGWLPEAIVTGLLSALLALLAWVLFEDRARRLRQAWARLSGKQA